MSWNRKEKNAKIGGFIYRQTVKVVHEVHNVGNNGSHPNSKCSFKEKFVSHMRKNIQYIHYRS